MSKMLLLSGIVEIASRVLRLVDALREKRDDSGRFPSVGEVRESFSVSARPSSGLLNAR